MFLRYLIASLILILLGRTPLIDPLHAAAAMIGDPLQYGAYRLGQNLSRFVSFWANLAELNQENFSLEEKIVELESRLAFFKELERENSLLREQLNLPENQALGNLVLAEVVGRSQSEGRSVLVINKGRAAGVRAGAAVVVKNFLLGEVVEVSSKRAEIRLVTDPNFSAAALDQDSPDRAQGLVKGRYGTGMVLEKVLPHEEINVGETMITSGEDGKFVKGLILGQVESVSGAGSQVFKSAKLKSPLDLNLLEEVFVIK